MAFVLAISAGDFFLRKFFTFNLYIFYMYQIEFVNEVTRFVFIKAVLLLFCLLI
jgi:hypothetical protein